MSTPAWASIRIAAWVMEVQMPKKDYGSIGNGDIVVETVFFGFGEIQDPPVFLHYTAMFEIVHIRPL